MATNTRAISRKIYPSTNNIKHMRIVGRIIGDNRQFDVPLARESIQALVIKLPQFQAFGLNAIQVFELGKKKGSDDIRGEKRRADVNPAVLVDLALEEFLAIRALLPEHVGTVDGETF